MQQLLGGAAVHDRPPQAPQRVAEQLPVGVGELRSLCAVANQPLSLLDSICEVRRGQIDRSHPLMQPLERMRVLARRDLSRRHRLVVGPQRDREAVAHIDTRLHPRIKLGHGAIGFGEPPSDLDLERRACPMRYRRDPRKHTTGQQAHREAVRVVKNNRVFDLQVQRRGRGHTCGHRERNFCCLHRRPLRDSACLRPAYSRPTHCPFSQSPHSPAPAVPSTPLPVPRSRWCASDVLAGCRGEP